MCWCSSAALYECLSIGGHSPVGFVVGSGLRGGLRCEKDCCLLPGWCVCSVQKEFGFGPGSSFVPVRFSRMFSVVLLCLVTFSTTAVVDAVALCCQGFRFVLARVVTLVLVMSYVAILVVSTLVVVASVLS